MKKIILIAIALVVSCTTFSQVCLKQENGKLEIKYFEGTTNKSNAHVQYRGQTEKVTLKYLKEHWDTKSTMHPIIDTYFNEIVGGKITGKYQVNYGANQYTIIYIRAKDKKKFEFFGYAGPNNCTW